MNRAQSIVGYNPDGRPEHDFYPTPKPATYALLDWMKKDGCFPHSAWECACGDGSMSNVILTSGIVLYATDLYDRGDELICKSGLDFLSTKECRYEWIITNPPYSQAEEFVRHALSLTPNCAMLMKLQFLSGQKRKKLFEEFPLHAVLVFSNRLSMYRNGIETNNSGMIDYAWFVWCEGKHENKIHWITSK